MHLNAKKLQTMNNQKKKILVVDDDAKIVKALCVRLQAAGYETISAANGADGLMLSRNCKPDLIITDIWMPIGVGFSVAFRLRETNSTIPIIFITASKQEGLKEKAIELGGVAFFEKPYSPVELLATVTRILGQGNTDATSVQVHEIEDHAKS